MTTNTRGLKNKDDQGWGATRSLGDTSRRDHALATTWQALWIQQLYRVFLGRSAKAVELLRHQGQLAAGLDPAKLARALAESREGRTLTVQGLYRRYLGRSADPVGLTHYRKALAGGRTRVQIERDLLVSAEYAAVQGGTLPGWLRGLYQDVHGRAPDAAGFQYFAHDLAHDEHSKAAVALVFLDSHERREGWVRACFVEVLGRSPAPNELSSWVRSLAAGADLDEIRYGLAASLVTPDACLGPRLGSSPHAVKKTSAAATRSSRSPWGSRCRAKPA